MPSYRRSSTVSPCLRRNRIRCPLRQSRLCRSRLCQSRRRRVRRDDEFPRQPAGDCRHKWRNAMTELRTRNIVLVHGAFADGSGWKPVADILTKDGYKVSIVQPPMTSLEEDIAATRRIL